MLSGQRGLTVGPYFSKYFNGCFIKKKTIYFDQHLFAWDGKAKSILFSP